MTPITINTGPAIIDVSRDVSTGVVTLTTDASSGPIVFTPDASLDVASFSGLSSDMNQHTYFRKATDGAAVALFTSNVQAETFTGTAATRQSDTSLPTTGIATYSGDYLGALIENAGLAPTTLVTGTANVNVDFDVESVDGEIVSRRALATDTALPDVELIATPILPNGSAFGSAEFGTLSEGNSTFALIVAGADADTVVGQVVLEPTMDEREFGIFLTE